jgi:hypothetical protein
VLAVCRQEATALLCSAGQSPAGKNVSMEAENVVGIRHQATIGEDTAD